MADQPPQSNGPPDEGAPRFFWVFAAFIPAPIALTWIHQGPGIAFIFLVFLNFVCSAVAALGIMWPAMKSKPASALAAVALTLGFFAVNAVIVFLAGCSQ